MSPLTKTMAALATVALGLSGASAMSAEPRGEIGDLNVLAQKTDLVAAGAFSGFASTEPRWSTSSMANLGSFDVIMAAAGKHPGVFGRVKAFLLGEDPLNLREPFTLSQIADKDGESEITIAGAHTFAICREEPTEPVVVFSKLPIIGETLRQVCQSVRSALGSMR